jgi:Asp-tRNA(Asn)/Glu-tRNA(Gln) amidotransferase C subunit
MSIEKQTIENLATLARLAVDEQRVEKFHSDSAVF